MPRQNIQRQNVLDKVNKGFKTCDAIALELNLPMRRVSAVLCWLEKQHIVMCKDVRRVKSVGRPAKEYEALMFRVP